ncbi:MAG TPA: NAD(P)-dependent oxidoreductase [Acetobacteraceae bacterium]|nr:NAD(P)-dependent oxidoreductase [Acetobacteraceae bacterium]
MDRPSIVCTFGLDPARRATADEVLGGIADVVCLPDLDDRARSEALKAATVLLAWNTGKELRPGEAGLLAGARLIQFMSAGVDFIPLGDLPAGVPVATNGGAYAEPMAEHALATALAAAKRLLVEQAALRRGEFNQTKQNRMLAGGVCGILGFGGVGAAMARLAHGIGMRVHAINRSGRADAAIDWIGTPDRLDELLVASHLLVIAVPLTRATRGLIDGAALARMKPDAILVNLARGEIIDEAALYRHLLAQPGFTACIDAWWVEPVRHGTFRMDQPFLDLPNVIGSPHNSAQAGSRDIGLRRALANCRRAVLGETPQHLLGAEDRVA